MAYRDERDALEGRVQELEEELAAARETIARLQGGGAAVAAGDDRPNAFLGAPIKLHLERELPFEITDEGYEAIAELLRVRLAPGGTVAQVGRTLTFQRVGLMVKIARTGEGRTLLRLDENHGGHAVLLGAGLLGGAIVGLVPVVGILRAFGLSPAALLVAMPLLLITCYAALRALITPRVHADRRKLAGVLESVGQVAARHARPARARIAASASKEAVGDDRARGEEYADPEAEAEAERREVS